MICIRERVEVVEGSHEDPAVVTEASKGADSIFWLAVEDPAAETADAAFTDISRPAAAAGHVGFSGVAERPSRKKKCCRHESCFAHLEVGQP